MNIRLTSSAGDSLIDDFPSECDPCINSNSECSVLVTCPLHEDKRRIGILHGDEGSVFCCSNKKDYIKSNKTFKREQQAYIDGIRLVDDAIERLTLEVRSTIHNLTKTNAHNIQELYAIVPQDLLTQDIKSQLASIKGIIAENPHEAAKAFLRIAKNNASMKVEFSALSKLEEKEPTLLFRKHSLKRVTLNLLHIFYQDFNEREIEINIADSDLSAYIDFEIVHLALYNLFHNATKYALRESTIDISFKREHNDYFLSFGMLSLRIEKDELPRLCELKFSGDIAKRLGLAGDGIGLARTARILKLNNAELLIETNTGEKESVAIKGIPYDYNRFTIVFRDNTKKIVK